MRALRTALSLAALIVVSSTATAQQSGTVELGVFGHVTRLDKDVGLGDNSVGLGGRLGLFVHRLLAIEAEYGFGTIGDNARDVSGWVPFRGFVVLNAPIGSRVKLLLGGGYKFDTWMGDTTTNEFEDAFTGLAGLRVCMSNGWSVRPEVVFDMNPSPNNQRPVTSTSKHVGFRLGVSKFLGRGSDTCQGGASGAAAPARGPVPPPPPAVMPAQQAAPPVVTPPPPPPPPTVTLFASPSSISAGGSSTLNWSSTNATTCSAPWTNSGSSSGSQSVSPTSTTTYTTTCTGPGGTRSASTTVNVSQPAPPAAPPREMFRLEGVYFDFDKATIKPEGRVKLDSAVTILNRYSDMRVEIQGHTDSVGSDQYNQGLSERRATAVRAYLVEKGISGSRLTTRGFGESQPATSNDTAAGRAQNRRVMLIELR